VKFPRGVCRAVRKLFFAMKVIYFFFVFPVVFSVPEGVDQAKAGDKVTLTGTLIVVPDVRQMSRGQGAGLTKDGLGIEGITGLKILGLRDLTYKLCFLACTTQNQGCEDGRRDIRSKETRDMTVRQFSPEERERIVEMSYDERIYHHMTLSVCPTIYGHEIIKRGILLMLLGGVHKQTLEHTKIRGDINICIVGDPSTAKSQFLKYVADFLPRAVYTSGKASSAAGLTASVKRDDDTNEFCIEAGALMLADNVGLPVICRKRSSGLIIIFFRVSAA
jgi:DNA replication licensing factor MCM6